MKRALIFLLACIFAAPLLAQTAVEIRPRIVQSDSPTRRTDLNFQMAATSGFSVTQVAGSYNLYGPRLGYRGAWNHQGTDMLDLVFPQPNNPDWCYGKQKPCDPLSPPLQRDPRCGDSGGVVWKTPLSSVDSWLYLNTATGASVRVPPKPAVGAWPHQWPFDCPLTGPDGFSTITAAKINAAIPAPIPAAQHNCPKDIVDPATLATGAADYKTVYVNGKWYMGFCETVNNPDIQRDANGNITGASWTAGDLFIVGWAVSNDGKNWTVRRQLFRTTYESQDCGNGMLLTQLTTDGNYFYMLVDELLHRGLLLFRAPIDQAQTDGFTQWQIATNDPLNANRYKWVNTPANGFIDTAALNAFSIMPGPGLVRQGAMVRVASSSAPGSPSRIIGITNHSNDLGSGWLELWSAPDLDTPFTFESMVDTTFLKPIGLFGWEMAFTFLPNQGAGNSTTVGNEFDFWLIGNFYQAGQNLDGHARHLTAYRMTSTLSGGIYSPRAALRTAGGYYVGVTAGTVSAPQTTIAPNTRFVFPKQGSTLSSNETVTLVARNGNYLSAVGGGGGNATATPNAAGANETFTIVKASGSGAIANGDSVAIRSANGRYLTAQNGGGGTVDFTSTTINANSTFVYTLAQ